MKTLSMITVLSSILISSLVPFSSCNKNNPDVKDYKKIQVQSDMLKAFGVKQFYFRTFENGYEVYLPEGGFEDARLFHTFSPDKFQTTIAYSDRSDRFTIQAAERDNRLRIYENRKLVLELVYVPESRNFLNQVTGKLVQGDWSNETTLNPRKYLIAGALTEEVISVLKLYENPVELKKSQEAALRRSRKSTGSDPEAYSKENIYESPCKALCRSDPNFSGGKTGACYQAKDENTNNCCISGICLGCCEHIGCDCYTLIGDYFGWCVAISKACSST